MQKWMIFLQPHTLKCTFIHPVPQRLAKNRMVLYLLNNNMLVFFPLFIVKYNVVECPWNNLVPIITLSSCSTDTNGRFLISISFSSLFLLLICFYSKWIKATCPMCCMLINDVHALVFSPNSCRLSLSLSSRDCPIFYMRKKVQKDLGDQEKLVSRFGWWGVSGIAVVFCFSHSRLLFHSHGLIGAVGFCCMTLYL